MRLAQGILFLHRLDPTATRDALDSNIGRLTVVVDRARLTIDPAAIICRGADSLARRTGCARVPGSTASLGETPKVRRHAASAGCHVHALAAQASPVIATRAAARLACLAAHTAGTRNTRRATFAPACRPVLATGEAAAHTLSLAIATLGCKIASAGASVRTTRAAIRCRSAGEKRSSRATNDGCGLAITSRVTATVDAKFTE